jgi:MoxR-like ATPase
MTTTLHPVAARLHALRDELAVQFPERRKVIEAILLAILSKNHFYLLGFPGTAKSLLTRNVFGAIVGATFFEALLSKNRPGEALLGPYSLQQLREQDRLWRKIQGYLPDVNFALLDELGKMSPTTGHDILAILNERRLHQVDLDNGRSWIDVPLYTAGAASNEIPTDDDNSDAAALWDRILVRIPVEYVQETSNWLAMLDAEITPATNTVQWVDLKDVIDTVVPAIVVPMNVKERLVVLKEAMRSHDLTTSDRRWRQCMDLIRASAFMGGRTEATVEDVQVLRHALWDDPSDISMVERLTIGVSDPIAREALDQLDQAEQIAAEVRSAKDIAETKKNALATELSGRLNVVAEAVKAIVAKAEANGSSTAKPVEVLERVQAIQTSIYVDLMNMDMDLLKLLAAKA